MNLRTGVKILCALGSRKLFHYFRYRLTLWSGLARLREERAGKAIDSSLGAARFVPLAGFDFSAIRALASPNRARAIESADEIAAGFYRPYRSGARTPLLFSVFCPDQHWSRVRAPRNGDVKDLWEAARFSWAEDLARGWTLTSDVRYPTAFGAILNRFLQENPPFSGVQALSAQETALRLIQVALTVSVFSAGREPFPDPVLERMARCTAERILTTRDYAIAQNNNHWLSEAAGLMTVGAIFPDGSRSERYFRTGWRDFQSALKAQLLPDGEYVQYSANYHRFALQLVLWVNFLLQQRGMTWPMELILPLRRSIRKLSAEVDSWSGGANNVGHNDGALLFAFGSPFGDYRPTLQACARVFFGRPFFAPGPWDELGVWLRAQPLPESLIGVEFPVSYLDRTALRLERADGWASLRAVAFRRDRPAQSDQLHVSIWAQGKPIVLDPGTYRYNGAAGFENRLKLASLHNGLVIDDIEPMTDAGKFLWLDWRSARILEAGTATVMAEHFAYRSMGATAKRRLSRADTGWLVEDSVRSDSNAVRTARINWLLPEAPVEFLIENGKIRARFAAFSLCLCVEGERVLGIGATLLRGGKVFREIGAVRPIPWEAAALMGWFSPVYATLLPAVSLVFTVAASGRFTLRSDFRLDVRPRRENG